MEKGKQKVLPRPTNEMSQDELEDALKKKKECNARAVFIVEKMIDNPVNKDWFLSQLTFLRQSHFQDVIEERSILRLCGYPLCCERLKDMPTHKYRISLKTNRVYDTTERQKFCSNLCYQASSYLEKQLLTSPIWLEDPEEQKEIMLMPTGFKVHVGVEIGSENDIISKPVLKKEFISINQMAMESLDNVTQEDAGISQFDFNLEENTSITIASNKISNEQITNKVRPSPSKQTTVQISKTLNNATTNIPVSSSATPLLSNDANISFQSELHSQTVAIKQANTTHSVNNSSGFSVSEPSLGKRRAEQTPLESHVEKCLQEWITLETVIFMFGEHTVKECIIEKRGSVKEYSQLFNDARCKCDPKLQDRYEKICRRLSVMEMEDNILDCDLQGTSELKPLPDYKDVQEDAKSLVLKVNAFYQGKTKYNEDAATTENIPEDDQSVPDNMPLVDSHSQKALRRKLVIARLSRVLSDWSGICGLPATKIIAEVRTLINTLSLEPHNITFKPMEWRLLGLIIVDMLALKDPLLKSKMDSQKGQKYQIPILASFRKDCSYVERLIKSLTDMDNLLQLETSDTINS